MIQGGDEDVYTHNVTISGGIIRASGDENVFLVETNSYTAVNMDISGGEIYSFTGGNLMNVKGEVAVSGGLLFNLHNSYEDIVIDNIIHARSTGALHVSVSGDAVIACFNTNSSNRKLNVLNGAARLGKKDNENGLFYTSGSEERFLAIQALTDDDINVPSSLSPVNANRYAFAGITNGRINLNLPAGEYAAGLYHVDGRMAGKADVKAENGIHTTTLDTHKLPQGVYILNVKQSGISVIKHKIIIR